VKGMAELFVRAAISKTNHDKGKDCGAPGARGGTDPPVSHVPGLKVWELPGCCAAPAGLTACRVDVERADGIAAGSLHFCVRFRWVRRDVVR
jgi:hypothetical protein